MSVSRRVIAYTRVSTDGQAEDGEGLDIQREKIKAYADARGFRVIKFYRETGSGAGSDSIANRPEFQKALTAARKGRLPILVADINRVGRDEESVQAQIDDSSVVIISVRNGEHADRAVIAAQAREAEHTAKIISKTTKAALRARKKEGMPLGNRTNLPEAQKIGQRANQDRFLKRSEEYLRIVQQIDPENSKTRKQIVDALNERGLKTDRGLTWSTSNFRRLHEEIERMRREKSRIESDQEQLAFEERQKRDPLWGVFC